MGNRAVITFAPKGKVTEKNCESKDFTGIYLHWNGGRDSVEGFLKYCKFKGYRSPEDDRWYAMASLVNVISNFFGGGLSIGIGTLDELDCDNYDNGVYVVWNDWEIVDRIYYGRFEQDDYELEKMLNSIDSAQPENMQLGSEEIHRLLQEEKTNDDKQDQSNA